MQVTDVLEELSQRDYTSKTVTGTKRPQTNFLKEESTNRQHGRVWGLTVTFVRNLPYCSVSPWLPLACPRHGNWAIPAWLAQAADSLYVSVVSVTSSSAAAIVEQSRLQRTERPKGSTEERQEADTRMPSIHCISTESVPPPWANSAAINEHVVPSFVLIHKCADSPTFRLTWALCVVLWFEQSLSRSHVLPRPPALTNDLIVQLVNIVPRPLLYPSADPPVSHELY